MLRLMINEFGVLVLLNEENNTIIPIDGALELFFNPIFKPAITVKMDLHLN